MLLRRYTFKLYPSAMQKAALIEQSRMMAQLWNALLQRNEDLYGRTKGRQRGVTHTEGKSHLGYFDMCGEITVLRQQCPEWRALSTTAARGVAQRLNEAFKAFFKRAKQGAGAASGYPRYKRTADGMSICFTEKSGVGWAITRHADAERAGGWRVRLKGVTGAIKARGRVPVDVLEWSTGEIVRRDGTWWLSAVVRCQRERAAGDQRITIRFDLIDEFARVERAKGGAPACSQEQITGHTQCDNRTPGVVTPNLSGDETQPRRIEKNSRGVVTPNLSGDETELDACVTKPLGVVTQNLSGDETLKFPDLSGDETDHCRHARRYPGVVTPNLGGEVLRAALLCERADAVKSARDTRYPRRPFTRPSWRWRRETARAAHLTSRAARIRKHALHRWSYALVRDACDLTVIAPAVKDETASPRGDKNNWGANVDTVSNLNRHTLNQAPALAIQMIAYKAAEAGIRCDVTKDQAPKIAVGRKLVAAGKAIRKTERAIKRQSQ